MSTASADVPLLDKEECQKIYLWIDAIPLSRPKRNITRDFSDGGEPVPREKKRVNIRLFKAMVLISCSATQCFAHLSRCLCSSSPLSAVLVAEVVHAYFPKLVQLHNYSAANSVKQKMYNWGTLNKKVFKRMSFDIKRHEIEAVVNGVPGMVEVVLMRLQARMSEIRAAKRRKASGGGSGSSGLFGSAERGDTPGRAPPARGGTVGTMLSPGSLGGSGGHSHDMGGNVGSRAPASGGARAAADPAAGGGYGSGADAGGAGAGAGADLALLAERERRVQELEEMNEFMELKIRKLEQLVQLKDSRIHNLQARLQQMQMGGGGGGAPGAAGGR